MGGLWCQLPGRQRFSQNSVSLLAGLRQQRTWWMVKCVRLSAAASLHESMSLLLGSAGQHQHRKGLNINSKQRRLKGELAAAACLAGSHRQVPMQVHSRLMKMRSKLSTSVYTQIVTDPAARERMDLQQSA